MRMTRKQMNQFAEAFGFTWIKNSPDAGYVEYTSNGLYPGSLYATETKDCNVFDVHGALIDKNGIDRETYEALTDGG